MFDGTGASLYPGRWNERNQRVVYVTTRLPLGILEILVQDSVTSLQNYGAYPIEIPDGIALETVDRSRLSSDWRTAFNGRTECRAIGDAWFTRAEFVGLIVPSAVVPEGMDYEDFNIVLNPLHADFARIEIGARITLAIDTRLESLLAP